MIHLDKDGKFKYNQLKGKISPKVACNVNCMCSAYEMKRQNDECWEVVSKYHTELKRIPDKLIYFLRHDETILSLYQSMYKECYINWINDETRDKDLYSDDSTPPNEVLKILCMGFNIFMNRFNGDVYENYCEFKMLSLDDIKAELDKGNPIVSSFYVGKVNHIMVICGYDESNIFVEDTYGLKTLKKYPTESKAYKIPFYDFVNISKPTSNNKKFAIVFNN